MDFSCFSFNIEIFLAQVPQQELLPFGRKLRGMRSTERI